MKKFAFISGTLSMSLSTLGVLFKIMHWPGANVLMIFGFSIFALFFIPAYASYLYKKTA